MYSNFHLGSKVIAHAQFCVFAQTASISRIGRLLHGAEASIKRGNDPAIVLVLETVHS